MTSRRIDHGPRYSKLLPAIKRSIAALKRPLTASDIAAGWSDEIRALMLVSYEHVLSEISQGSVETRHYKNWIKGLDHIDSRDQHVAQLLDDSLAGERAIRDIQRAEEFLEQVSRFLALLAEPRANEVMNADSSHVTKMIKLLVLMSDRLEAGEYLKPHDFWAWDALTTELGYRRRQPIASPRQDYVRHPDLTITYLESKPNGFWWERLAAFDSALVNFAGHDIWSV